MEIPVVRNVLEANDRVADELKNLFAEKNILVLNLMSSPGAGKTTLLERTLTDLKNEFKMAVIEGDLQTVNDARRVAATGAQAVQINTEGGCHLDSAQVRDHKITLLSVTEGDDKPEKYPLMFHISSVMLLNKSDLLPYVDFDVESAKRHASKLNKDLLMLTVSCRTGEGLEPWYEWLRKAREAKKK
jgi:hydrogenase nickel incorporation protein HypB